MPEWEGKIDLIRRTVAAGATADELGAVSSTRRAAPGLDPLAKQIYFVKRQGKGVIQVGIDGLRLIADRTGAVRRLRRRRVLPRQSERGFPAAAKVVVYKMVEGQRCPFGATARWDEYFPGDAARLPVEADAPTPCSPKCAEALALRKAFPADMSGLYVHEEMEQAGSSETAPLQVAEPSPVAVADGRPEPGFAEPDLQGTGTRGGRQGRVHRPKGNVAHERRRQAGVRLRAHALARAEDVHVSPPLRARLKIVSYGKARERMLDARRTRRRCAASSWRPTACPPRTTAARPSASLFIDWLMNADDETLDRASAAAEAEPRPELELN